MSRLSLGGLCANVKTFLTYRRNSLEKLSLSALVTRAWIQRPAGKEFIKTNTLWEPIKKIKKKPLPNLAHWAQLCTNSRRSPLMLFSERSFCLSSKVFLRTSCALWSVSTNFVIRSDKSASVSTSSSDRSFLARLAGTNNPTKNDESWAKTRTSSTSLFCFKIQTQKTFS